MQGRVGLDLVAQDEVGAGIAGASGGVELVAECGQGLGAAGRGERVEPDEQLAGAGVDVAGGGEGLADQRVCLVAGAGVVAVQGAGQGGLGVVCCGARKYDSGCDLRFLVATLGGQTAM